MRGGMYDFYGDNGMHRMFNNHGLKAIDRGVDVPDAALGIGFAEVTAPVPLLVSYAPIIKQPDTTPVVSVDDTFVKTKGNALQLDTFSQSGYYGEAIGGF